MAYPVLFPWRILYYSMAYPCVQDFRGFSYYLILGLTRRFQTNPHYPIVQDFPENPVSCVISVYPCKSAVLILDFG